MKRPRSALTLGIILALLVIAIWWAHKRKVRQKHDAAYQAIQAVYSRDLRPGTKRKDVRGYLRARNTSFKPTAWIRRIDDLVQIGEDNDASWPFTHEWVYVDFEYPSKPQGGLVFADSDVLEKIELVRIIDSPL